MEEPKYESSLLEFGLRPRSDNPLTCYRAQQACNRQRLNMASPFGFSAGDVLSAVNIIKQVIEALRSSSTAADESASALVTLNTVRIALQMVRDTEMTTTDGDAFRQLQECAKTCSERVLDFSQRIEKYNTALGARQDGQQSFRQMLERNTTKVRWTLAVKDDLDDLMASLTPQLATMQLLLSIKEASSMRLWHADLLHLTRSVQAQTRSIQSQMDRGVARLEPDTVAGAERKDGDYPYGTLTRSSPLDRGKLQAGTMPKYHEWPPTGQPPDMMELKRCLEQLLVMLAMCLWHWIPRFCHVLRALPRSPTTVLDTNITLTDALGRVHNLPYEHFSDWSMVVQKLVVAFKGCVGEEKIHVGRYVIYSTQGRCELLSESSWERTVRPGTKTVMAMVVSGQGFDLNQCPRCGCHSNTAHETGWATWCVIFYLATRSQLHRTDFLQPRMRTTASSLPA